MVNLVVPFHWNGSAALPVTVQSSLRCETSPKLLFEIVVRKGSRVLIDGCPGPSVGVNNVVRSVT